MARKNTTNQVTKAQATLRRQRCMELRLAGKTPAQIGAELGISPQAAAKHIRETLKETAELTKANAEEYRDLEVQRLDRLIEKAEAILARFHIVVSQGKIIRMLDKDGVDTPLRDDGPELAAIARLQSLSESRRKLLGLDAPTKLTDGDGNSPIKVIIGIDPEDG
jgi:DNA-binding CsgD family transcriptional regulator